MGFFTCDPRFTLSNSEESEQQVVSENEGVSIFFGKSSIESVKSLVGKRCSSIPTHYDEESSKSPSSGSVARKAAFFDHYIRTVSLEKATTSAGQMQVQETDSNHGEEEDGQFLGEEQVDHVQDNMEMEDASCSKPDHVEETAHIDEEEQEYLGEEGSRVLQELTEDTMIKLGITRDETVVQVVVPATDAPAVHRKRSKPTRKPHEQSTEVINKWRSKHGLIPGVRAAVNKPQQAQATAGKQSTTTAKPSTTARKTTTSNKVAKVNKDETLPVVTTAKEKSAKVTAVANGFHFRSNERAEKRKEFNRRMEEKMSAKEAEKNKIQAKTEEELQAEIKELRRTLNFKATPMPGFYQPVKSENRKLGSASATRAKPEERPSNGQPSTKTKKVTSSRQQHQQQQQQHTKSKALMGKASAITVSS